MIAPRTSTAPADRAISAGATGHDPAGVRVYVRGRSRRAFVAAVIAPLCRTLDPDGEAQGIALSSGWRFGSHLDLRADPTADRTPDWATVAVSLAAEARRHPPALDETDADYLKTARLLGQIEQVAPPYLPRRPHGDTELLTALSGPLGHLTHSGRAHLLAPLLETAGAGSDGELLARVAEAFLALAGSHPYGVRFGTFSFRSHAEAFFQWAGPAADYRSMFENRMGKDLAVLQELVRRVELSSPSDTVVRSGAPCDAVSSGASGWARAFSACQASFAGRITEADLDGGRRPASPMGPVGRSAFHRAVDASGVIDQTPAWFAGFRLTINLFYQLLPVLDVSPVQRFYLCHAIAETVDQVAGESWQDRLASVATLMGAAR